VLALVTVAVLAAGVTFAAFSATTSNSGNSFSAASSFGPLTARGAYTGNATNNRAISVGFQPDFVLVKADAGQVAVATTSAMGADNSKALSGGTAPTTNLIKSLSATGFTVGTANSVNQNGTTYHWLAVKAQAGAFQVGSYTGNNGASKAVTGLGFSPDYVGVLGSKATAAVQRYRGAARSYPYDNADAGTTTRITSFDTDGFTVGNSSEVNSNNTTFYYWAVKTTTGGAKVGSYAGNGVNGRSVTGVGFLPEAVLTRADDTSTARRGGLRTAITGSTSLFFSASAPVNTTNGIESFDLGGFTVGTDGSVNASGPTYYYLAFR
jgi:hypothetical protein